MQKPIILDGKKLADIQFETLLKKYKDAIKEAGRQPKLGIVQVGDNPSSNKYIEHKMKRAELLGVKSTLYKFDQNISQNDLLKKMDKINEDEDGIVIQLPLPSDTITGPQVVLDSVQTDKDIDGLCSKNKFVFYNNPKNFHFVPAVVLGILDLLEYYKIPIDDQKIAVIGRSEMVGKPIAHILKMMGGKVYTYNEKTGIKGSENADLLIVAAGKAKLVKRSNVKEGAVVIDVGCNLDDAIDRTKLIGDVDFDAVCDVISAIAPVPGGVGPLTVVSLFKNLLKSFKKQYELD